MELTPYSSRRVKLYNMKRDWLSYIDESDSSAVLADINGPGCIYRIWSTGNVGDSNRIKIYLDGNPRPAIDSHTTGRHRR